MTVLLLLSLFLQEDAQNFWNKVENNYKAIQTYQNTFEINIYENGNIVRTVKGVLYFDRNADSIGLQWTYLPKESHLKILQKGMNFTYESPVDIGIPIESMRIAMAAHDGVTLGMLPLIPSLLSDDVRKTILENISIQNMQNNKIILKTDTIVANQQWLLTVDKDSLMIYSVASFNGKEKIADISIHAKHNESLPEGWYKALK